MTTLGVTIALLWFATFAFIASDALFNEVIATGGRRVTRAFFGTNAQWVGAAFLQSPYGRHYYCYVDVAQNSPH